MRPASASSWASNWANCCPASAVTGRCPSRDLLGAWLPCANGKPLSEIPCVNHQSFASFACCSFVSAALSSLNRCQASKWMPLPLIDIFDDYYPIYIYYAPHYPGPQDYVGSCHRSGKTDFIPVNIEHLVTWLTVNVLLLLRQPQMLACLKYWLHCHPFISDTGHKYVFTYMPKS